MRPHSKSFFYESMQLVWTVKNIENSLPVVAFTRGLTLLPWLCDLEYSVNNIYYLSLFRSLLHR